MKLKNILTLIIFGVTCLSVGAIGGGSYIGVLMRRSELRSRAELAKKVLNQKGYVVEAASIAHGVCNDGLNAPVFTVADRSGRKTTFFACEGKIEVRNEGFTGGPKSKTEYVTLPGTNKEKPLSKTAKLTGPIGGPRKRVAK